MKRAVVSILAGAALLATSTAFAAASSTPLAPGGAAGIHAAQSYRDVPVYAWVGGALVVVGLVWVLSDTGNSHAGNSTSCAPGASDCSGGGGTGSTGTN